MPTPLPILTRKDHRVLERVVGVRRKTELPVRILGSTPGKFPLTDKTIYQTLRLGGRISKIRVGVPSFTNITVPFKMAVAVGADGNNGYQLRTAAGAVIAPTLCTFGTNSEGYDWEPALVGSGIYTVIFLSATKYLLNDPNGAVVSIGTVGVAFTSTKLGFTISAGGNAFAAGDGFTITVDVGGASATSAALAGNTGNGAMGAVTINSTAATTTTITNARGSYNGQDLREGIIWADPLTVNAGDPIDGQAGHWVTIRGYSSDQMPGSTGNPPEGSSAAGWGWIGSAEIGYQQGYWYGDQTTAANPGASVTDNAYGGNFIVRAIFDKPGQAHVAGGDSTMKGYSGGASEAAGGVPGDINGYVRLVRNAIRARGTDCELFSLAQTSEQSTMFLRRLLAQIATGRYTHAWIQVASVNDTLGPGSPTPKPSQVPITQSLDLVRQCLAACYATNTFPILCESSALFGAGNPTWHVPHQAFLDQAEAAGIAVHRAPELLLMPDRVTWRPEYRLDGVHPNYAGHKAQAADIVSQPDYYQLR